MSIEKSDSSAEKREKLPAEEQLLRRPADEKQLEEVMRSSRLVMGGFLGPDSRSPYDIIEEDLSVVWHLGYTVEDLALRMQSLTQAGVQGMGCAVVVEENLEVSVEEHKGMNVCPWPHRGGYRTRITTVRRLDSGKTLRWTDLGIHMIRRHGFFEGRGSHYRLEPRELIAVIF